MKKVIFFILSIIFFVVMADLILGRWSICYVKNHHLPGRYQPLDKLIKDVDTDILLIGNSLIQNGLNPQVLEDSLGMTCYNGGIAGQGLDFFETIVDCALQRYTPRIVVMAFRPEEMGENVGAGLYEVLRPYYHTGYSSLDEHFDNVSPSERFLLKSSLYRFNVVWARILIYSLFDRTEYTSNGFYENKVPSVFPVIRTIDKVDTPVKWKMDCMERIIQKCQKRGIKLCVKKWIIFFRAKFRVIVLCFMDYVNQEFLDAPELFSDNAHLNINGAIVYSQLFSSRLKEILDK